MLLRDNKQSGPYTAEEMIAKGFKPYDLIWVEGKSAGWRYPSELPEFKKFTATIEEQPYDRFYKKKESIENGLPLTESDPQQIQIIPALDLSIIAQRPKKTAGKVFVTLPHHAERADEIKAREDLTEKKVAAPASLSSIPALTDARPAEPLPDEQINGKASILKSNDTAFAGADESGIREKQYVRHSLHMPPDHWQEQPAIATTNRKWYPLIIRVSLAASLLLGGVIIGLLISNNRQAADHEKLNQLVKAIQEKQNSDHPAANTVYPVAGTSQSPANTADMNTLSKGAEESSAQPPATAEPITHARPIADKALPGPANTSGKLDKTLAKSEPGNTEDKNASIRFIERKPITSDKAGTEKQGEAISMTSLIKQIAIKNNEYKVGLLGGISNLSLTMINHSDYLLDQVEVNVAFWGPEKKLVKSQTILFNDMIPGAEKTLEVPRSSRGVSISYKVTRIQSRALGLTAAAF